MTKVRKVSKAKNSNVAHSTSHHGMAAGGPDDVNATIRGGASGSAPGIFAAQSTYAYDIRQIKANDEETLERLEHVYKSLSKLKLLIERVTLESRKFLPQELFEASTILQVVSNNLIVIKCQDSELANIVRDVLYTRLDDGSLELKAHMDRDTIAHVLNLDYFHKSHTEEYPGREPLHQYWQSQIFSKYSIFKQIEAILVSKNLDLSPYKDEEPAITSVNNNLDCYYGLTETHKLPQITGALISRKHNKYDYQRTFSSNGQSVLQLLKYNIDLAIRAQSDSSKLGLIVYINAVEALGNCAKILKNISYDLPEDIETNLEFLIEIRNKFAHAYSIEWMARVKEKSTDFHELLESLLKNLSDIDEANLPSEPLIIKLLDEVVDLPSDRTNIKPSRITKKSKTRIKYEEEEILYDALAIVQKEIRLLQEIREKNSHKIDLSIQLFELTKKAVNQDLFEEISALVKSEGFDINLICEVKHKPVSLNAKMKKGKTIIEINKMEFEDLFYERFKADGEEITTKILPINALIYLSQQTSDNRYSKLLEEITCKQSFDLICIKKLNPHINPILMFVIGNKILSEQMVTNIKNSFEEFAKAIITEYRSILTNCENKIYKFLAEKLLNIYIPIQEIGLIGNDMELLEYYFRNKFSKKNHYDSLKTLINHTIFLDKLEALKYLSEQGIRINYIEFEASQLAYPIHSVSQCKDLNMLKFLLDLDPDFINKEQFEGQTPLTISAGEGNVEFVRFLLGFRDVNVNHRTKNSHTALTIASEEGHLEVVKALLEDERIDPNMLLEYGEAAITRAIGTRNIEVFKFLYNSPKVDIKYGSLQTVVTAIRAAETPEMLEVLQMVLNHPSFDINEKHEIADYHPAIQAIAQGASFEAFALIIKNPKLDKDNLFSLLEKLNSGLVSTFLEFIQILNSPEFELRITDSTEAHDHANSKEINLMGDDSYDG